MKRLYKPEMVTLTIIALVLIGLTGIQSGCARKEAGHPEKIIIAVAVQPISAPVYVAYAKGYFTQEGLEVTLQQYWAGKDALASVLKGTAHFGTVAETPVMFAGLKNEKFFIIATIADSNKYMKIVARKDSGIGTPEDLKGKRVGVSMGTTAEYFLDALLTYNRIPKKQIQVVPMEPENMADALVKGAIDAAVAWNPHMAKQQKLLGTNALTIENESIYKIYWNIVAAQDFTATHPETVKKFLRALLRAENYIRENRAEAYKITSGYVGREAGTFDEYNFDLRLPQSLLIDLEDQARWAIDNRLTERREIPNYLRIIYADGMEAVAPRSVTVIHK